MIWNLQCFKTLTFAISFLLLVHGIIGDWKDGPGRFSPYKSNRRPPKQICANPYLINGEVNRRLDGFEFTCKTGFKLFGRSNSRCVNGSLNHPPPVCTAQGCPLFGRLNSNLEMTEPDGYRGSVVEFRCHPGYTLKGPDRIHCNGQRWSKGPPHCIEDVTSTTSPTPPRNKDEKTTPSVLSNTDITSSISIDNKALQSSAVTTASRGSKKAPRTSEMPETETQESTLEDNSLSSFDHNMRRVTTQIDEKPELTYQAANPEIDEPEQTMNEFPSSPAGVSLPSIDIQGVADAGPSNEVELTRATKIYKLMTEVEHVKNETLNFTANAVTYPVQDKKHLSQLKARHKTATKTREMHRQRNHSSLRVKPFAQSTKMPRIVPENSKAKRTKTQSSKYQRDHFTDVIRRHSHRHCICTDVGGADRPLRICFMRRQPH